MNQKLLIDFYDTNSTVELPLGDNVVLFGENGTGKTRVLKTINSIIELSKVTSDAKIRTILKELNIKNFKINGVSYEEIFQVKKEIINKENSSFIDYFREYKDIFEQYVELKSEFISSGVVMDNYSNAEIRRTKSALDYLKNSDFPNDFRPNLIRTWKRDMERISIRELKDSSLITTTKLDFELEEYERIVSLIISNYFHNSSSFSFVEDTIQLTSKKKTLKKELAKWSVAVISTNEKDFELFFSEIRKKIIELKSGVFSSLWESSGKPEKVLEELRKMKDSVIKFNEVIKRYFNLEIELDDDGEFKFYKSENKLEISKFSSGERNVIFLFLKLIFSDNDLYLIDEPEVSLSLSFQKRIVGDIFDVIGNKKVIIATHAPYIYKDFKAYSDENKGVKIEK